VLQVSREAAASTLRLPLLLLRQAVVSAAAFKTRGRQGWLALTTSLAAGSGRSSSSSVSRSRTHVVELSRRA
jgi:hypothetical protein